MNQVLSMLLLVTAAIFLHGCNDCLETSTETASISAEDVEYAIGDEDPSTACEALCLDYGYDTIDSCETIEVGEDGSATVECTGKPICK